MFNEMFEIHSSRKMREIVNEYKLALSREFLNGLLLVMPFLIWSNKASFICNMINSNNYEERWVAII